LHTHATTARRKGETEKMRISGRAGLLLAAAVLLCFAVTPGRAEKKKPSIEADQATLDTLPEIDDPAMRKQLKCNACAVVTMELRSILRALRNKKKRKLDHGERLFAVEHACNKNIPTDFGLQMRSNKVTTVFSNDPSISRTQGNWISTYLTNACGEVIGDFDEALFENVDKPEVELTEIICKGDGLGVCPNSANMATVNTHSDGWTPPGAGRAKEL